MSRDGLVEGGTVGAGLEGELCIEGEQAEDVVVLTLGRARPSIADLAGAVLALSQRPWRLELAAVGHSFGQARDLGREAVEEPVREQAAWCVGIVDDERQLLRLVGNARPGQCWRDVVAVARVAGVDALPVRDGTRGELETGGSRYLLGGCGRVAAAARGRREGQGAEQGEAPHGHEA